MSKQRALESIAKAARNAELIRNHTKRSYLIVVCILRLAELERLAEALGSHSAELAIDAFRQRLGESIRKTDELIPLSERRWALILKGITSEDHVLLALAHLDRVLAQPVVILEEEVRFRINLGYAVIADRDDQPEAVFWRAEQSLDEARKRGVTSTAHTQAGQTQEPDWALRRDLERALNAGEFKLYFQPKTDARFYNVQGAEALVRWHSNERGVVAPGKFIDVIESTDLVMPFTQFVIKHALAIARLWPKSLSIAVNLPPAALFDPGLMNTVSDVLAIFDFEPQRLVLEVTEGSVMGDIDQAVARLAELRAMGMRISLDDFGTGYSSLAHLSSLPLDELKVDRSFVALLANKPDLVKYVIDLAHSLGLKVVAEGVETEGAAKQLGQLGANQLQGFWISPAIPEIEFQKWLVERGVA